MAEKKQGVSYESVMKDLKARNFSPVYLLMGDESYYIDKICDYLMEHALQPEERDFNQVVLFGSPSVTAVQVVDQCKGYPMMAEHRVVILKEAQNLKNFEALDKYLENPVKSTILSWFRHRFFVKMRLGALRIAFIIKPIPTSKITPATPLFSKLHTSSTFCRVLIKKRSIRQLSSKVWTI